MDGRMRLTLVLEPDLNLARGEANLSCNSEPCLLVG